MYKCIRRPYFSRSSSTVNVTGQQPKNKAYGSIAVIFEKCSKIIPVTNLRFCFVVFRSVLFCSHDKREVQKKLKATPKLLKDKVTSCGFGNVVETQGCSVDT